MKASARCGLLLLVGLVERGLRCRAGDAPTTHS